VYKPVLQGLMCNHVLLQAEDLGEAERLAGVKQVAANLNVGNLVVGVVTSVQPFGVFVDLGKGVTALLHIRAISDEWLSSPEQVFKVSRRYAGFWRKTSSQSSLHKQQQAAVSSGSALLSADDVTRIIGITFCQLYVCR
jgi:polyribonucleotide nucleotidyltransferase